MSQLNYSCRDGPSRESSAASHPARCLPLQGRWRRRSLCWKGKEPTQQSPKLFNEDRLAERKTGGLIAEARDIDFIEVDNNKEALALENNLIKQYKPRFNILLRDDKTYPYVKLTHEKYPRVYVTRRILKDGATYYGPFFPGNLAHRLVHFIHRHFKVPSCKIDFSKRHTHPCLQFHIHRCLGPCVAGLTTDEQYAAAVHDVRLFLEGRHKDLADDLETRMNTAADEMRFEEAAGLRNLAATVKEMEQKQKMAAAEGENTDILAFHAEPPMVAVNLFHLRNGKIVDRREYFGKTRKNLRAGEFFDALLKQIYWTTRIFQAASISRWISRTTMRLKTFYPRSGASG